MIISSRDCYATPTLHMEQRVEEIASYCQEYVIGGSDKEPVRALARGIDDSILLVGIN